MYEQRLAGGRQPAYVSHCLLNNPLRDALPELLSGQRHVSVISCRDVKQRIEEDYGVASVRVFQTPSQYIMRNVDGDYEVRLHDVPMWPEMFDWLRKELTVRHRGEVFLIGAGIIGKALCIHVRDLGGIALDLGSTLDGIAAKITRYVQAPALHPVATCWLVQTSQARRIHAAAGSELAVSDETQRVQRGLRRLPPQYAAGAKLAWRQPGQPHDARRGRERYPTASRRVRKPPR